jgi:hypothetical protein
LLHEHTTRKQRFSRIRSMNIRAEFIKPSIQAASDVVATETKMRVDRGSPGYLGTPSTTPPPTLVHHRTW